MFKTEPGASSRNSPVAGYPDLIKTLEQLKSFLNDPRIAELDSCFDLTKRRKIKALKDLIEAEGERYTDTLLRLLEGQ